MLDTQFPSSFNAPFIEYILYKILYAPKLFSKESSSGTFIDWVVDRSSELRNIIRTQKRTLEAELSVCCLIYNSVVIAGYASTLTEKYVSRSL